MISPIPLTPNMDMATLTNAINSTFQQIDAENRTKVIKDESGVNRIILGQFPNGDYGLIITKPGQDALTILG